jgi:dethiobiotin synthetase
MNLFLAGTDAGVGKTHTAIQLLRAGRASGLRCAGMKPICCGDREDAQRLLAASSEGLTIGAIFLSAILQRGCNCRSWWSR